MLGLGAPEILEQLVRPDEVDARALLDRAQPEGNGQMRLADARWAEEEDIRRLADEGQRGQVADLTLVDRRLEAELKLVERALKRQVGQPGARAQVALTAGGGLLFAIGLGLSLYRDRLLALPDKIKRREGIFKILSWR